MGVNRILAPAPVFGLGQRRGNADLGVTRVMARTAARPPDLIRGPPRGGVRTRLGATQTMDRTPRGSSYQQAHGGRYRMGGTKYLARSHAR